VEDNGATGGCQSNCEQPGPQGKDSEQLDRVIGYYEAWRYNSECQGMVSYRHPRSLAKIQTRGLQLT
jgi:hypothetical protein